MCQQLFQILTSNKTIPVILCDANDNILSHSNIDDESANDSAFLKEKLSLFKKIHEPIVIEDKDKSIKRYLYGGIIFGLGWALAGACPGPMFVLTGAGYFPILVVIFGAVLGTWLYGLLKKKLPH